MYEVFQLDATCWRIEEDGVRCFLLTGTKEALLIDSGLGTGDLKATVDRLTCLPIRLVNTHADRDHIGCNHQFPQAFMHPAEFDRYQEKQAPGLPAPTALWEGEGIDLGERVLEILLIPGHTPGSIALLDRASRLLFSGDSIQDGQIFMFGPGRNLPAYIASMEKLSRSIPLFDHIHPSHGSVTLEGDFLGPLLDGARRILRSELQGKAAQVHGQEVTVYDTGTAKFLCSPDLLTRGAV